MLTRAGRLRHLHAPRPVWASGPLAHQPVRPISLSSLAFWKKQHYAAAPATGPATAIEPTLTLPAPPSTAATGTAAAVPPPPVAEIAPAFVSDLPPILSTTYNPAVHLEYYLAHSCGVPWWVAITATLLGWRLVMAYFAVVQQRNSAYLAEPKAKNIMAVYQSKLQIARQSLKGRKEELQAMQARLKAERDARLHEVYPGTKPMRGMERWLFEAPMFVLLMRACYVLSDPVTGDPSMRTGGALWFPDLTAADPTGYLPFMLMVTSTVVGLANMALRWRTSLEVEKYVHVAMAALLPVFMYWLFHKQVSCILVMLIAGNLTYLMHIAPFIVPSVRAYCEMPPLRKKPLQRLPSGLFEEDPEPPKKAPPPLQAAAAKFLTEAETDAALQAHKEATRVAKPNRRYVL